jgi:hypothetical protein
MTKSEKARAIITGSYILFLIDGLLDNANKTKGSTIMLKQRLLSKTRKVQNLKYIELSNEAWNLLLKKFEGSKVSLIIFDAVETLAFNEEKIMKKMYGDDIFNLLWRFITKQTPDDVDLKVLAESREITNELTKIMKKLVYDKLIKGNEKC